MQLLDQFSIERSIQFKEPPTICSHRVKKYKNKNSKPKSAHSPTKKQESNNTLVDSNTGSLASIDDKPALVLKTNTDFIDDILLTISAQCRTRNTKQTKKQLKKEKRNIATSLSSANSISIIEHQILGEKEVKSNIELPTKTTSFNLNAPEFIPDASMLSKISRNVSFNLNAPEYVPDTCHLPSRTDIQEKKYSFNLNAPEFFPDWYNRAISKPKKQVSFKPTFFQETIESSVIREGIVVNKKMRMKEIKYFRTIDEFNNRFSKSIKIASSHPANKPFMIEGETWLLIALRD